MPTEYDVNIDLSKMPTLMNSLQCHLRWPKSAFSFSFKAKTLFWNSALTVISSWHIFEINLWDQSFEINLWDQTLRSNFEKLIVERSVCHHTITISMMFGRLLYKWLSTQTVIADLLLQGLQWICLIFIFIFLVKTVSGAGIITVMIYLLGAHPNHNQQNHIQNPHHARIPSWLAAWLVAQKYCVTVI